MLNSLTGPSLPLDDHGLPLPGRELDRWMAENVFDREPLNARHGLHKNGDIEYYWGYPVGHDLAPAYSTTHAFFRAMEAMRAKGYEWQVDVRKRYFQMILTQYRAPHHALPCSTVARDESDIEKALAGMVCQLTWKAMKGEKNEARI